MTKRRFGRSPFGVDPWGPTEEFEARLEKKRKKWMLKELGLTAEVPKDQLIRSTALKDAPKDWRVDALYADVERFNREDTTAKGDPFTVDHIRELIQGGKHIRENLRIIRRSQNCDSSRLRSEEEIKMLLLANAIRIKIMGR